MRSAAIVCTAVCAGEGSHTSIPALVGVVVNVSASVTWGARVLPLEKQNIHKGCDCVVDVQKIRSCS